MTTQFLSSKIDVLKDNIDQIIDRWLEDRQTLLVLYHELCLNHASPEEHPKIDKEALQLFREVLTDYSAFGHFQVFEKLAEVQARHPSSTLNKNVLLNILRTTLAMLDFSDKYGENCSYHTLNQDLSKLGEELAKRLDLEDILILQYRELNYKT